MLFRRGDARAGTGAQPAILRQGNEAHQELQKDWLTDPKAQGNRVAERRILKRSRKSGRVDVYIDVDDDYVTLVEIKNTDRDRMAESRVRANVLRHVRQLYTYIDAEPEAEEEAERQAQRTKSDSEWVGFWDQKDVSLGLVYTRMPRKPERLRKIEELCAERLVHVVWQDEPIEETTPCSVLSIRCKRSVSAAP